MHLTAYKCYNGSRNSTAGCGRRGETESASVLFQDPRNPFSKNSAEKKNIILSGYPPLLVNRRVCFSYWRALKPLTNLASCPQKHPKQSLSTPPPTVFTRSDSCACGVHSSCNRTSEDSVFRPCFWFFFSVLASFTLLLEGENTESEAATRQDLCKQRTRNKRNAAGEH